MLNIAFLLGMLGGGGLRGRSTSERPDSLRSSILGRVIPPAGPKVHDLRAASICGVEVECLRVRRCIMGGIAGDGGTGGSVEFRRPPIRSDVLVLRLSRLGLRFMEGMTGLIKEGEVGSDGNVGSDGGGIAIEFVADEAAEEASKGGWIERPFILRGRRGEGEVMGRSMVAVVAEMALVPVERFGEPALEFGERRKG